MYAGTSSADCRDANQPVWQDLNTRVAPLGQRSCQSARARHHSRAGAYCAGMRISSPCNHATDGRLIRTCDDEQRKVARDAYVSWQGKPVFGAVAVCRQRGVGARPRADRSRSATAPSASRCMRRPPRQHQVITHARASRRHPARQPAAPAKRSSIFSTSAPVVEHRPLAAYEAVALGGAR